MANSNLVNFCTELDKSEYWHIPRELMESFAAKFPDINFEHLTWAFWYYLPLGELEGKNPYIPAFQFLDGSYPPQFDQITPQVIGSWTTALEHLKGSLVAKTRLADLISVTASGPEKIKNAEIAFEGFCEILNNCHWEPIRLASIAERCLGIARQYQESAWINQSISQIIKLVANTLASSENSPGVVIPLIELLSDESDLEIRSQLIDFIETAQEKYCEDFYIVDKLITLRGRMENTSATSKAVALQRIHNWEKAANSTNGLIASMHLNTAINIARNVGLKSELPRLQKSIEQIIKANPPELQRIDGKTEIPKELWEINISKFLIFDNYEEALLKLSIHCPVPIDRDKDHEYIRALMKEFPIQHMATKIILNGQNLPIAHLETYEAKFEYEWSKFNTSRMLIWATIFHAVLTRIDEELTSLEPAFIRQINMSEIFTQFDKVIFEKCFKHYVKGNLDEFMYLAIPRIESALRSSLEQTGAPIYKVPSAGRAGSYLTLERILNTLAEFHPLDTWDYASAVLNDRFQLNLRNEFMHGLVGETNLIHASLVLHLILNLSVLRIRAN